MRSEKVTLRFRTGLQETPATDQKAIWGDPITVGSWARDVSGFETVDGEARQAVTYTEFELPFLRVLQDAAGNPLVDTHCEFVVRGRFYTVERALLVSADDRRRVRPRAKKAGGSAKFLLVRANVRQ